MIKERKEGEKGREEKEEEKKKEKERKKNNGFGLQIELIKSYLFCTSPLASSLLLLLLLPRGLKSFVL